MSVAIVVPARDEAKCIDATLRGIREDLSEEGIDHTILVVDDHSYDNTTVIASRHAFVIRNQREPGYGNAVRYGLANLHRLYPRPTWVTVMTADGSDDPYDLLSMIQRARGGDVDAVFGHRWIGADVTDYPRAKRLANRLGNHLAAGLVGTSYTDLTNPFKLYRASLLSELVPHLRAPDFSLGLELAVRYLRRWPNNYAVVPTSWTDRAAGTSKFRAKHALGFLRTLWRVTR